MANKMKEMNKIKLAKIGTVLLSASVSNIGGNDVKMIHAKVLNEFGNEIFDIIEDELKEE